jgi:hypothetical protein
MYSLAETPQHPPPPPPHPHALGLVYDGAIGQQRLTTSLCNPLDKINSYYMYVYDNH